MLSLRRIERLVSFQHGTEVLGKAVRQMRSDAYRDDASAARTRTHVQVQKDYEGVQMKSSREQFEEWIPAMIDGLPENMASIFEDMLFTAWQASRAAIEVELPDKVMVEGEFDNGHNCAIDYCADAIRAAGLTVKGES